MLSKGLAVLGLAVIFGTLVKLIPLDLPVAAIAATGCALVAILLGKR